MWKLVDGSDCLNSVDSILFKEQAGKVITFSFMDITLDEFPMIQGVEED